ncbi:MAG TPA: ATP-binding cassette domain-containing protein, partial [Anaerolineae bacterium]|nr:ATP-binding cassette domain-containing protein [Anaerolineae bacterium]
MSQPIHVSTAHRTSAPALSVQGLTITYQAKRGDVQAVRNVSFDVGRGEALAIIGESGSGKTTLGLGIVRLLPSTATIRQG